MNFGTNCGGVDLSFCNLYLAVFGEEALDFFFQHKKLHISQFIFSKNNFINISQKINELFLN